jgi:cephalosporin hydroxylase
MHGGRYYSADVWRDMYWLGVKLAKVMRDVRLSPSALPLSAVTRDGVQVPSDMWLYQELLVQLRPSLLIEFGTFQGGSALYFATILSALPPPPAAAAPAAHKFKVVTVDIHGDLLHPTVAADARIEAIAASSTDAAVERRIRELLLEYVAATARPAARPPLCQWFTDATGTPALCSPFSTATTAKRTCCRSCASSRASRAEATVWWWRTGALPPRLLPSNVTPCSNVNGHPVALSHGPGPYEAIDAFFEEAPGVFVGDAGAEGKFGFTAAPAGWLVRA